MRWGITAVIDPCKCLSIGKSSCPSLVPALPALFSTTTILHHGHRGVRRAALDRDICMWLLEKSCTEMVMLHCQRKPKLWLWLASFECDIAFIIMYGLVSYLVTFLLLLFLNPDLLDVCLYALAEVCRSFFTVLILYLWGFTHLEKLLRIEPAT